MIETERSREHFLTQTTVWHFSGLEESPRTSHTGRTGSILDRIALLIYDNRDLSSPLS